MNIFILEDNEERMKWFNTTFSDCAIIHTDNVSVGIEAIKNNNYDIIFLDRDLGEKNPCGEELTEVMMKEKLAQDACIVIHTNNPWGRRIMREHFQTYHKNVYEIEFTELMKKNREDFKLTS
jgi:DNA-binding LytR/AlgR family response regulator